MAEQEKVLFTTSSDCYNNKEPLSCLLKPTKAKVRILLGTGNFVLSVGGPEGHLKNNILTKILNYPKHLSVF